VRSAVISPEIDAARKLELDSRAIKWQQFKALLIKRWLIARRDWKV
jgi:hypothetical protein